MQESLEKYLGPQKVAALENYLFNLMFRSVAQCPIVGSGVWPVDESYRTVSVEATSHDSLWTHVVLSVRGSVSKATAERVLSAIDEEISSKLSPEQQPPRLSFSLDDDSSTLYRAKSRRVRGTLPESRESPKP